MAPMSDESDGPGNPDALGEPDAAETPAPAGEPDVGGNTARLPYSADRPDRPDRPYRPDRPESPAPRDPWAPPADEPSDSRAPSDRQRPQVGLTKDGREGPALPIPPPPSPGAPAPATGAHGPGGPRPGGHGPGGPGTGGHGQLPPPAGYPPPAGPPYPGYPSYPGQPSYPGYPGYPGYPAAPYGAWGPGAVPRNGFGVTALVLGVVGTVLGVSCLGALLGLPAGIAAVVFGIVGVRTAGRGQATNRGQAIAGIVLGAVSSLVSVVMIALVVIGTVEHQWFDENRGDDLIPADSGEFETPLPEGGTATYDDGLRATVSGVRWADDTPSKYLHGGRAVRFTVTVRNTGDQSAELSGDELSAYEDEADEDPLRDVSDTPGLPSRLAAGGRAGTDVVVVVPASTDDLIQVQVTPGYAYDYTYWYLGLPQEGLAPKPDTGGPDPGTGTSTAMAAVRR
jgi:hypothetical protein